MKKVLLLIMDGFGHSEHKEHNAIAMSDTPNWNKIKTKYPSSLIGTSGDWVGLPDGIMGNSEVGHITIGSGRILLQDLSKITKFAKEGGFLKQQEIKRVAHQEGVVHLFGLLSDGGVHSDIEHLKELVKAISTLNSKKSIVIHPFMDGRDTPPKSGIQYINEIENFLQPFPNAKIGTVIGRFYAMDRDKRWERVEIAYKALTQKDSNSFSSAKMAIDDAYSKNETDEFVLPRQVTGTPRVSSDDQIVFFNFRADRAREISVAFGDPEFKSFEAKVKVKADNYITFSEYQEDFKFPVIFKRERPKNVLGELYASKGLRQLRVAETEKYAHVTYFFNGGEEEVFKNEERVMVPSPKDVKTYDQKPEMSVFEVTDEILKGMDQGFDLIVANFANGDMVGHTGNEEAAIKAVEAMDKCLGKILEKSENKKYEFIITADHGNCEQMIDPESGVSFTQHTTNLVPLVWVGEKTKPLRNGGLADIAPTILDIVGWQQPAEMTGNSLIVK